MLCVEWTRTFSLPQINTQHRKFILHLGANGRQQWEADAGALLNPIIRNVTHTRAFNLHPRKKRDNVRRRWGVNLQNAFSNRNWMGEAHIWDGPLG